MSTLLPLQVRAPARAWVEFAWVCEVLFGRLGLPFELQPHAEPFVEVVVGGGRVRWADAFLGHADGRWLRPGAVEMPAARPWKVPDDTLRRMLGRDDLAWCYGDGEFSVAADEIRLPIDVTGSAFFMLSRYEEAVPGAALDVHGRFPGSASWAGQAGLLRRPLVDEWIELLWWAMQRLAPGLRRQVHAPRVWVTCDVDLPYSPAVNHPALALRQSAAFLLKQRRPLQALQALANPLLTRLGSTAADPCDNFGWLMDTAEAAGQRADFFFICAAQATAHEGFYRVEEPRIAQLIDTLRARGHGVGLHASYASADDPSLLAAEVQRLRRAAGLGDAVPLGNRQHYLRWRADETPAALAAAGLAFDSSLGHADQPGFRCGTSHAFPLYDLRARHALPIVERPLVLMEGSVISPAYLNLGLGAGARALMLEFKAACRRYQGCFTLLWHNDGLNTAAARRLYAELIQPFEPLTAAERAALAGGH